MNELIEDRRLAQTFAEPLPGDSKSEISRKQKIVRDHVQEQKPDRRRLRETAVRLGLPPEVQGRPGFGPLIASIAPQIGPTANEARAVWAYISGLSHSSYTRTPSASDIELLSAEPRTQALLTAKPSTVSMALDGAFNGARRRGSHPDRGDEARRPARGQRQGAMGTHSRAHRRLRHSVDPSAMTGAGYRGEGAAPGRPLDCYYGRRAPSS